MAIVRRTTSRAIASQTRRLVREGLVVAGWVSMIKVGAVFDPSGLKPRDLFGPTCQG
jgi:hypothetical protein